MPENFPSNKRALDCILPCYKLLKRGKFAGRGTIPESFTLSKDIDFSLLNNHSEKEHSLWVLSRHITAARSIPSFTALKSLLTVNKHTVSSIAFTPIIPHPATSYDTIFTAMINFQDILKQKGLANGPLWSDEGVYRLAKEIQLLQPDKFNNFFLGIGGFHLEKVVISCIGKYLEVPSTTSWLKKRSLDLM